MKGLPTNVDLEPLFRARVIQLCFGENEVQVHFDKGARVVVESEMLYRTAASTETRISKYAAAATVLCRMPGQQVVTANREADGGLSLRFDGGDELHVLNDSVQCESFQIHIAGKTYVG
jgi:hypothetical protein